jgi:hypothetical protein
VTGTLTKLSTLTTKLSTLTTKLSTLTTKLYTLTTKLSTLHQDTLTTLTLYTDLVDEAHHAHSIRYTLWTKPRSPVRR